MDQDAFGVAGGLNHGKAVLASRHSVKRLEIMDNPTPAIKTVGFTKLNFLVFQINRIPENFKPFSSVPTEFNTEICK